MEEDIKYANATEKVYSYVDIIKEKINFLTEEEFKEVQRCMYQKSDELCGKKEIMKQKCRIISELDLDNIHALDSLDDNVIWKIVSLLNQRERGEREYAMLHQELKTIKAVTHWDRDYLGIKPDNDCRNVCCGEEPVKEKAYPYRG